MDVGSKNLRNKFYKLRHLKSRQINHLRFLIQCRKCNIIPKFIKLSCNLKSTPRLQKTLHNARMALLRSAIHSVRTRLANIEKDLYLLHLNIAKTDPMFNFVSYENGKMRYGTEYKSFFRTEKKSKLHQKSLEKKFLNLQKENSIYQPTLPRVNENIVVNLTDRTLTSTEKNVLELGLNFAVSKTDTPKIIASVEKSLTFSRINQQQKETLRYLVSDILRQNKPTPNNLHREEKKALFNLKKDPNLVILKADKGGQIVVMSKEQYLEKTEELIKQGPYMPLTKNPMNIQLHKVKHLIKSSIFISEKTKREIIPSVAHLAKFYAVPKVHKTNIPLRPIVSNIGTASYMLAKFLVSKLSPLLDGNKHTVKNSIEFSKIIHTHPRPKDFIFVSFDVKSLFTMVPTAGAISCLEKRLKEFHFSSCEIEEILKMVKVCIEQTTFTFQQKIFRQTEGLAMGNPLSPILSDIYMHFFEEKLFKVITFNLWIRYVDDTFVIWEGKIQDVPTIAETINSIDPSIQFTYEVEKNGVLPFLDVQVQRTKQDVTTTIYRKPYSVNVPPHNKSCHPYAQKMAAFYTYVHRALKVCSDEISREKELNYIRAIAINRGYSASIVNSAIKKLTKPKFPSSLTIEKEPKEKVILPFIPNVSQRISSIFKSYGFATIFFPHNKVQFFGVKDKIPDDQKWGIYHIPCQCEKGYIGQTKRALKYRINEHRNYVKKQELNKSAIAQHCWEENHTFNFNNAKIIQQTSSVRELDFYEAYHIHNNLSKLVNVGKSIPPISLAWKDYFSPKRPGEHPPDPEGSIRSEEAGPST